MQGTKKERERNLEQTASTILEAILCCHSTKLSLTFLWYRLKPDSAAAAAEVHADEEEEEDVLAVSDDAPRSARSRDCDLIVSEDVFFFCEDFDDDFSTFDFSFLLLSTPSLRSSRHMLRRPLTRVEVSSDDKELVRR